MNFKRPSTHSRMSEYTMENWVLCAAIVFVVAGKVLQYTSAHHEAWVGRLTQGATPAYKAYAAKLHEQKTLQEENHSISAQDNYARWTKNNRKLDKLAGEVKELRAQVLSQQGQGRKLLKNSRLLLLTLPFLGLKLWKGKEIVYYLPSSRLFPHLLNGTWHQGWLFLAMYPLKLVLSRVNSVYDVSFVTEKLTVFSGPAVGVSLGIWLWALTSVLASIEFVVNTLVLGEKLEDPVKAAKKQ
ncbi:GET complex subunit [Maudiozyma humilis]|uniref:Golgi to ER traffic protein 1 n=1 Tax=Maudiozyma humilis TaxID=51915 RepID=A0AAV5S4H9_MAUHU|nr:GET complex subunit [Kazachstania humilis]